MLSNSALVNSLGHGSFLIRADDANSYSIFDASNNLISIPRVTIDRAIANYVYGLAEDVDAGVNIIYRKNQSGGQSFADLGDTLITLGFQVSRQANSRYLPDFRITIEELFPTGRYNNLIPSEYGTDATGAGSYQTMISFNFARLSELSNNHFLSIHGSFGLNYPSSIPIHGFSIYGGSTTTSGSLTLGKSLFADLAAEYNITQNWAGVIETFIFAQQPSSFSGSISDEGPSGALPRFAFSPPPGFGTGENIPDTDLNARPFLARRAFRRIIFNKLMPSHLNLGKRGIGNGNNVFFSLAPAIEYNFSAHLGLIGGAWFTVAGKNTPNSVTSILMLVSSW
ncbi:MAG: hypothetical protein P1U74_05245 [Legionellaceae bacterium]|nr:hypothetical protein [Legionellaceae bacterium]